MTYSTSQANVTHHLETIEFPTIQQLLWITHPFPAASGGFPRHHFYFAIRNHADVHVLPFPKTTNVRDGFPADAVPHDILLLAEHAKKLKEISRISAYVLPESEISRFGGVGMSCQKSSSECRVLGLRVEYVATSGEAERCVGFANLPRTSKPQKNWPEQHWHHFEVDGPRGEYVTEVGIAMEGRLKAIKVGFGLSLFLRIVQKLVVGRM